MAAVKALETFKGKNAGGKAVLYLCKCDEAKRIDAKTVKNLRHWVQVRACLYMYVWRGRGTGRGRREEGCVRAPCVSVCLYLRQHPYPHTLNPLPPLLSLLLPHTQVPERDSILRIENVSSVDTDPEQIRTVRRALLHLFAFDESPLDDESWGLSSGLVRSIGCTWIAFSDRLLTLTRFAFCFPYVQQLLKALALDAHKAAQARKAAEAEAAKQKAEAAAAKACCTIA